MFDFLRDYQDEALRAVLREWETVNSTLVVLPTGMGKTVLAAAVVKKVNPKRVLFLVHRDTLAYQAKRTIEEFGGTRCEIEMAGSVAEADLFTRAGVVITTVQTQIAGRNGNCRMHKFKPGDFDYMIIDEGHHYTSPGWRKCLTYYRQNPNLKVMGITATPDRADETSLKQIFETCAYDCEILDGVHEGWLLYPEQQYVRVTAREYDLGSISIVAGDLHGGQLAKVMENEHVAQDLVGSAIEIAGDKQFVFFCKSKAQAEMVSNIFNRHRAGMCDWMCDETPKDQRRVILKNYDERQLQGLANVGVLTEGWDSLGVTMCFMGRPTLSRSLYAQMAGRVLRPLKGVVEGLPHADARKQSIAGSAKPRAFVVDYVDNSHRHSLICTADILGGKVSDEAVERAKKKAMESQEPVRMDELLDRSEEEIRAEIEKRRREEEARKARLVAKVKYNTTAVDPFDVLHLKPVRPRIWDEGRQLSQKQQAVLIKQGIDPGSMPYSQAKQLLNEIFRRWDQKEASFGQAKVLKKYSWVLGKDKADPGLVHCSQQEAAAMLDIIGHTQGWKAKS